MLVCWATSTLARYKPLLCLHSLLQDICVATHTQLVVCSTLLAALPQTSLVRALSTMISTAALDKNPQSRERGITLDLGFSAFQVSPPAHLAGEYDHLQFTLVDCPGHASLIRTIIGGAQIIDMMLLVVDATKGMQTQSAECVVIGYVHVCAHSIIYCGLCHITS